MSIFSEWGKRSKKGIVICAAVISAIIVPTAAMAANPFADVPAKHWAYDAVAQLAAKGIVSGYPDGDFGGVQHATRYEMASAIARAVANLDTAKVSKHDFEILKRLVIEFGTELNALGADVDKIDGRVKVLENNIGAWRISGSMIFDANFGSDQNFYGDTKRMNNFKDSGLTFTKFLDPNNTVVTRFAFDNDVNNKNTAVIDRMYLRSNLSDKASVVIGRFDTDWEAESNLYHSGENDGWYNHILADGFKFGYSLSNKVYAQAFAGRNLTSNKYPLAGNIDNLDSALYGAKVNVDFSEKFNAGATGMWLRDDNNTPIMFDSSTYSVYAGWNITPDAALRGVYYIQDVDLTSSYTGVYEDRADAWKVMLDIKQNLLKATSLWVEYGQLEKGFFGTVSNAYNWSDGTYSGIVPTVLRYDTKVLLIRADRKWSEQWGSFLRYAQADFDKPNSDKVQNWTFGLNYQYTPSVAFQLAYDNIDYGNNANSFILMPPTDNKSDNIIRFRTTVNF